MCGTPVTLLLASVYSNSHSTFSITPIPHITWYYMMKCYFTDENVGYQYLEPKSKTSNVLTQIINRYVKVGEGLMSQLNINACYTLKLNKSNLPLKGNLI